jgi:hypothetical protein
MFFKTLIWAELGEIGPSALFFFSKCFSVSNFGFKLCKFITWARKLQIE